MSLPFDLLLINKSIKYYWKENKEQKHAPIMRWWLPFFAFWMLTVSKKKIHIVNEISWDHCQIFEGGLQLMAHEDWIIHSPLEHGTLGRSWDTAITVETCHCPCCRVFPLLTNRDFTLPGCYFRSALRRPPRPGVHVHDVSRGLIMTP